MAEQESDKNANLNNQPTPSLQDLPSDAISCILSHGCTDFQSIYNLAETNTRLKKIVWEQHWKCHKCATEIFANAALECTGKHVAPFVCAVCRHKFCGEKIDYDKRFCRPQTCDGCDKVECRQCMESHLGNEDGYGTENYCQDCQAEFEFGMGGC